MTAKEFESGITPSEFLNHLVVGALIGTCSSALLLVALIYGSRITP